MPLEWEHDEGSIFGIRLTATIEPIGLLIDVMQEWDLDRHEPCYPVRFQGAIPALDLFTEFYDSIQRAQEAAITLATKQVMAALAELAPERNRNATW